MRPKRATVQKDHPDHAAFDREATDAALDAAEIGLWDWSAATDTGRLSPLAAQVLQARAHPTDSDFRLGDLVACLHPDDRPLFRLMIAEAVAVAAPFEATYRVLSPDGIERRVACRGRFEFDSAGVATIARGVVMDVSRRSAEGNGEGIEPLAASALDTWRAMLTLEPDDRSDLEPVMRALLTMIARKLAKANALDAALPPALRRTLGGDR